VPEAPTPTGPSGGGLGREEIQNRMTPKKPGRCYEVAMFTTDGSSISATFQLR